MTFEMIEKLVRGMVEARIAAEVEAAVSEHRAEFLEAFELERKAAEAKGDADGK